MRSPSARARSRQPALAGRAFLLCAALAGIAAIARADPEAGKRKAESCVACHGPMGNAANPQYPVLAGQTARYIYQELKDFKEGRRSDPIMTPMAAPLSREDMLDLGEYFAAQKPIPSQFKADGQKVEAGRKKADEVPCTMCHLGGFAGQNEIPRVAGQQYAYIVKQLEDFRSRKRTNDAGSMTSVARGLSDADIQNLANYIANLQ
ncbi:c-type cytochrome [Cupriavidus basilensis]|uniref:C-type cytochrome n=1 Tax=Cupriavidus basilensis TaxID=68895 RepID=A0ABT6B073_9BURK|nr:c-type cytochrome [Cupriavidus basilensis]MDF3838003.1 c-type cytochrome [Cupriavidus basilensis]